MKHSELLQRLQNLTGKKPKLAAIAKILGFGYSTIGNRATRDSEYSLEEIIKLSHAYKIDLKNNTVTNTSSDKVELKYYENPNLNIDIKNPLISSLWFDRELVENIWNKDPKNLRIIKMLGDKMDNGAYPLRNDDILIMDISDTNVTKAGIYAFTTDNDKYMFINGVYRRIDGTYRFYFYNDVYPDRILSDEEVKKADIKIIGRIIKNQSLTI